MTRALALSAFLGTVVAGVGCTHTAGKNDCTYDPADAVLPAPNNPYFPTVTVGPGPVPPAARKKSDTGVQDVPAAPKAEDPDPAKDGPAAPPMTLPKVDPTPKPDPEPAPKPAPMPKLDPAPKPEPMSSAAPLPAVPVLPVIPPLAPGF